MKRLGMSAALIAAFSMVMLLVTSYQEASAGTGNSAKGRSVHVDNCLRCHGPQGKGDGPAARLLKTKPANWTDKKKMAALSDDYLYKIIAGGGAAVGKSTLMPAFKGKLNDNQIRDLISFIRSL